MGKKNQNFKVKCACLDLLVKQDINLSFEDGLKCMEVDKTWKSLCGKNGHKPGMSETGAQDQLGVRREWVLAIFSRAIQHDQAISSEVCF